MKKREFLAYYGRHFNSAEITDTFQHLPEEVEFELWGRKAPDGFAMPVVAGKHITHVKHLVGVEEEWSTLLQRTRALGDKLGPILLQFPPSTECDVGLIERFLDSAPGAREQELAFEFRHQSWFDPLALDDLRQLGVAVVIAQSERYPQALRVPTARFVYLRFHGPGQLFASSYSTDELRPWARKIQQWLERGLRVYAYFNNDFEGHAIENAKALRRMVAGTPISKSSAVALR